MVRRISKGTPTRIILTVESEAGYRQAFCNPKALIRPGAVEDIFSDLEADLTSVVSLGGSIQ